MKRYFLTMFVMMTMLLISGCSHDEIVSQSVGSEVTVAFTTELRNDVKSRAVGDNAHQIDQVMLAVYGEGGESPTGHLPALNKTATPRQGNEANGEDPHKMYATIEVVLVKGQTYNFVFWAQTKSGNGYTSPYTFDAANATVSINYQKANDKCADAFYAKINNFTVTGTFQHRVDLRRPFAQVNFLTTKFDMDEAKNAGFMPSASSIVVKKAATSLNLLDGTVSGYTEATFKAASLITDETITIKNGDKYISCDNKGEFGVTDDLTSAANFQYLATAYFLPSESSITASMSVAGNTSKTIDLKVAGVNVQKNFRTNIYGNLLTSNGQFNIVVNPDSDGNHNVSSDEFTAIYTSLEQTMNDNKSNTDALTYNIQTSDNSGISTVSIQIPEGTAATSLTFNLKDLATDAPITIGNGANGNYTNPVVIKVPENTDLGNITIDLPGAHVTLKQGNYEQVISSTSHTTLVVTNGTKIEALSVKQGNVRIENGAEVTTIERDTENSDAITYVIYEGTLPAEANTNALIVYVSAAEFDLFNAATYGGEVKLTSNVTLTKQLVVTANTTIDLNGYTLSGESATTGKNYDMIDVRGNLTVKNGTITAEFKGTNMGWSNSTNVFNVTAGGILNLDHVVAKNLGGSDMAFVAHLNNWGEVTLNVNNSTLESTYIAVRVFNSGNDMNNVTIRNSTLKGKYCFWVHNYTLADFGTQEKADAQKALLNFDIFNDTNAFEYTGTGGGPVLYGFTDPIYLNEKGYEYVADGVGTSSDVFLISNASGMFWLANEVNENKNAFAGKTIKLGADIDLANAAWTPIGQTGATTFNGVFDGQNHTVSNLKIDSESQTGANYSSGLFGWIETHTEGQGILKNIKIDGANVKGHHNCGALVGYITENDAIIENCHVANATISCTKANDDADGDKAGALIGNATVATTVKDCTATNSTVSSGRDAGQLIGAGKEENVTGCSATNVTVSANDTSTGANIRNEVIGRIL